MNTEGVDYMREATIKRNEEIIRRRANGESRAVLAKEFGLKPGTINSIAGGYKGSGYESGHDYDSVNMGKVERAVQNSELGVRISCLLNKLESLKEKRAALLAVLDNTYRIYTESMPGSWAAELALAEMSSVVTRLCAVEASLGSWTAAVGVFDTRDVREVQNVSCKIDSKSV